MALTPEDVVDKRFQPTKFREGYDQDEVDDFLDEVVAELRRLIALNDELQSSLTACEQHVESLGGTVSAAPAADAGTGTDPVAAADTGSRTGASAVVPEQASGPVVPDEASSDPAASSAEPAAESAVEPPEQGSPQHAAESAAAAPVTRPPGAGEESPQAVAAMIALAQKVHDDYVRDGESERERVVSEAQEHATRLVQDAEEKQRQTLGALEQERGLLERKIDELRSFERDYRARLKAYLEGQLRDLDSKGTVLPSGGPAPEAAGAGG